MYRMSGIGRYLQTLLPRLLPLLHATKISVLGDPRDLGAESWASDPRIRFRSDSARIFSVAEQLAGLRGLYRGVDLLWAPQYNVPVLYRGRLLVTIHDVCQLAMPETLGNSLQQWYARFLFSRVAARASAVLCVSEFTAAEAQRRAGIDRRRITVAYPCLNDSWFAAAATGTPPRANPYFLTVGNLKKQKNLLSAIAAFQQVQDRIPHHLVIVGKREGFLNADTALDAALAGSNSRVVFTGQVPDEELRRYYRYAESLVFPSLYEGFGYPLVEAMALECPIACSRAASLPEVAGEAALYFDPASINDIATALLRLAGDKALQADLKRKGTARLEHFRGDRSVGIVAGVINRLLDSRA
jgi:glycosyltransferase involved in cell wall biosynthesis